MPKSGIYLTIMFLMVTNVVLGFVLMLLADYVWQNDALRLFGLGLAVVGDSIFVAPYDVVKMLRRRKKSTTL